MTSRQPLSPLATGFLFALSASALFAIRPILVKLVYAEGVDPTTLITWRMIFAAPIYLLLLLYFLRHRELRSRLNPLNLWQIAGCGLLGYYAASILDLLGLQYVSAQLGRMILYSYPTFVVLLGGVFFGQAITARVLFALLITYGGISVIFGHDLEVFGDEVIIGAVFITASAISFALYLLFARSLIIQVGSRVFTCLALLAASIAVFSHYAVTQPMALGEPSQRALFLILLIAIFCTVIPTFFTAAAVARIGADRTGITAMIGPGFTSVFAVWILSENFTLYHLIGIMLTIAGVAILQRR